MQFLAFVFKRAFREILDNNCIERCFFSKYYFATTFFVLPGGNVIFCDQAKKGDFSSLVRCRCLDEFSAKVGG